MVYDVGARVKELRTQYDEHNRTTLAGLDNVRPEARDFARSQRIISPGQIERNIRKLILNEMQEQDPDRFATLGRNKVGTLTSEHNQHFRGFTKSPRKAPKSYRETPSYYPAGDIPTGFISYDHGELDVAAAEPVLVAGKLKKQLPERRVESWGSADVGPVARGEVLHSINQSTGRHISVINSPTRIVGKDGMYLGRKETLAMYRGPKFGRKLTRRFGKRDYILAGVVDPRLERLEQELSADAAAQIIRDSGYNARVVKWKDSVGLYVTRPVNFWKALGWEPHGTPTALHGNAPVGGARTDPVTGLPLRPWPSAQDTWADGTAQPIPVVFNARKKRRGRSGPRRPLPRKSKAERREEKAKRKAKREARTLPGDLTSSDGITWTEQARDEVEEARRHASAAPFESGMFETDEGQLAWRPSPSDRWPSAHSDEYQEALERNEAAGGSTWVATPESVERLSAAHEEALRHGHESFEFEGNVIATSYAPVMMAMYEQWESHGGVEGMQEGFDEMVRRLEQGESLRDPMAEMTPELPPWFVNEETSDGVVGSDGETMTLEQAGYREFGKFGLISSEEAELIDILVSAADNGDELLQFKGQVYDTELTRQMLQDRQISRQARELAEGESWEPIAQAHPDDMTAFVQDTRKMLPLFNPFEIAKKAERHEVSLTVAHKLLLDEAMGIGPAWRFTERETEIIEHDERLTDELLFKTQQLRLGTDSRKEAGLDHMAALLKELEESTTPLLSEQDEVKAELERMTRILSNPNLPENVLRAIVDKAGQLGESTEQNALEWREVMARLEMAAGVGNEDIVSGLGLEVATEEDRNIAKGVLTALYFKDVPPDRLEGELEMGVMRGHVLASAAASDPAVWIRSGDEVSAIHFEKEAQTGIRLDPSKLGSGGDGGPLQTGFAEGGEVTTTEEWATIEDMRRPTGHSTYIIRDGYTEHTHTPFLNSGSSDEEIVRLSELADKVNENRAETRIREHEQGFDEPRPIAPLKALYAQGDIVVSEVIAETHPLHPLSEGTGQRMSIDPGELGSRAWKADVTTAEGTDDWRDWGAWVKGALDYMRNGHTMPTDESAVELVKEERLDGSYRVLVVSTTFERQKMYDNLRHGLMTTIRANMTGRARAVAVDESVIRKMLNPWVDNIEAAHNQQGRWWEEMLRSHGFEAIPSSRMMTDSEMDDYQEKLAVNFRERMLDRGGA